MSEKKGNEEEKDGATDKDSNGKVGRRPRE